MAIQGAKRAGHTSRRVISTPGGTRRCVRVHGAGSAKPPLITQPAVSRGVFVSRNGHSSRNAARHQGSVPRNPAPPAQGSSVGSAGGLLRARTPNRGSGDLRVAPEAGKGEAERRGKAMVAVLVVPCERSACVRVRERVRVRVRVRARVRARQRRRGAHGGFHAGLRQRGGRAPTGLPRASCCHHPQRESHYSLQPSRPLPVLPWLGALSLPSSPTPAAPAAFRWPRR